MGIEEVQPIDSYPVQRLQAKDPRAVPFFYFADDGTELRREGTMSDGGESGVGGAISLPGGSV